MCGYACSVVDDSPHKVFADQTIIQLSIVLVSGDGQEAAALRASAALAYARPVARPDLADGVSPARCIGTKATHCTISMPQVHGRLSHYIRGR